MRTKRLKRPRDPLALAKLVADIATGQVEDRVVEKKNEHAVELGRRGGRKGGIARRKKLTAEKRREIARSAAAARWKKS